jgi:hypothetical protein
VLARDLQQVGGDGLLAPHQVNGGDADDDVELERVTVDPLGVADVLDAAPYRGKRALHGDALLAVGVELARSIEIDLGEDVDDPEREARLGARHANRRDQGGVTPRSEIVADDEIHVGDGSTWPVSCATAPGSVARHVLEIVSREREATTSRRSVPAELRCVPMADVATTAAPSPLGAGYIERIRFSWERELRDQVRRIDDGRAGPVKPATSVVLIPLTPSLAPRPHRLANEVATTLGMTEPFELFQTRDFVEINAQAFTTRTPPAVRLVGPVVNLMNDAELRVMLGHELGHILAHGLGSLGVDLDTVERFRARSRLLAARCSVATEITADRFGLLAAQDLDAAVGVEIVSETGLDPRALEANLAAHLESCLDRVRGGDGPIANDSHPARDFRLFAAWLFWRTDVFRELTGKGTGELRLDDVDAELRERLLDANLFARVAPPPVVTRNVFPIPGGLKSDTSVEGFCVADEAESHQAVSSPWAARATEAWADAKTKVREAMSPSAPASRPSPRVYVTRADISPVDDLLPVDDSPRVDDDLERRFRVLERAAERERATTSEPTSAAADDLEARFLALEARFAKE